MQFPSTIPCSKISSKFTDDHSDTSRHVFTSVVSDAFRLLAVAPEFLTQKSFSGHTVDVGFASNGPIQGNISNNDVFVSFESSLFRHLCDEFSTRQNLYRNNHYNPNHFKGTILWLQMHQNSVQQFL